MQLCTVSNPASSSIPAHANPVRRGTFGGNTLWFYFCLLLQIRLQNNVADVVRMGYFGQIALWRWCPNA